MSSTRKTWITAKLMGHSKSDMMVAHISIWISIGDLVLLELMVSVKSNGEVSDSKEIVEFRQTTHYMTALFESMFKSIPLSTQLVPTKRHCKHVCLLEHFVTILGHVESNQGC